MRTLKLATAFGAAAALAAVAANAQEVTLKIHHFLPPKGTIQPARRPVQVGAGPGAARSRCRPSRR